MPKIVKIPLHNYKIQLFIKRDDLLHPIISGNKYRKLKYNLIEAKKRNCTSLITFGGAFSNHILAVAAAGKEYGFNTVGIIRGEELINQVDSNPTLSMAKELGMKFEFVTREQYRNKEALLAYLDFNNSENYILPEGGTNHLAVKGCEEILDKETESFTHVCCAVGTGGTISGVINASKRNQKIIGFSSLKGDFLTKDIATFANKNNWEINTDFHFGGYAKINEDLVYFLNNFYKEYEIPLDPVYTGKMMYGVLQLIEQNYFEQNSKILCIHTGGLQGIKGMNWRLANENKPQITYE
jgi:1-aminocyclopropane-1-carboxylate deaminase